MISQIVFVKGMENVRKKYIIRSGGYAYVPKRKTKKAALPFQRAKERPRAATADEESGTIMFATQTPDLSTETEEKTRFFEPGTVNSKPKNENDEAGRKSAKKPTTWFIERTKPRPFFLRVILMAFFMLMILVMGAGFAGLGALDGIVNAYVKSTPELNYSLLLDQDQVSTIYDGNGELITSFMAYENREWAKIDEIPDMLKNAFVAVEDVRFYDHEGIDFKRLFGVGIGLFTNHYDGGGSTITQQLIKIQVLGNEQSYKRKIQEAYLAMQLEKNYTKEQILEAYLNAIHLGGSNYGVKAAAEDYFGKTMGELTIRECAMLAGLTQNPNTYNPRKNMYTRKDMTRTNERTDTVLKRMYSAGFITKEQLESALWENVPILEMSKVKQIYDMPSFVEYALYDVITHMLRQRNMQDNKTNRNMIEQEIRVGGYQIYTTVDPAIQNEVQETVSEWKDYPKLRNPALNVVRETQKDGSIIETVQPQVAAVVMDYHTGHVKALVGRRDQATQLKLLNRAYNTRMEVGSSLKPLSIYAPALEAGASPASVYLNYAAAIEGYGGERGYPLGGLGSQGPVTMREGVQKSLNVVAARTLFETVGLENSKEALVNLGIDPSGINADGPGLALGTTAVSPLEMAAAYGTIANQGVYLEPVAFTKVLDKDGNLVLDSASIQIKRTVFQPATAWLMTDMLEDAVNNGTGSRAQISGMPVAGKTGTNSDYRSVYFAGYTPYYVASLWVGHDRYSEDAKLQSGATGGTYAAPLWQAFMEPIHKSLTEKPIIEKEAGEFGLVQREVCSVTGLLASSECKNDRKHKPVSDWFRIDRVPKETCHIHVVVDICKDSGSLASPNCPKSSISKQTIVVTSESDALNQISSKLLKESFSRAITGISRRRLLALEPGDAEYAEYYCTVHTRQASSSTGTGTAEVLLSRAQTVLAHVAMNEDLAEQISDAVAQLEILISYEADQDILSNQCNLLEKLLNQAEG